MSHEVFLLEQNLFSPEECKAFARFMDNLPLELTPPPKKGEAQRVNREPPLNIRSYYSDLYHLRRSYLDYRTKFRWSTFRGSCTVSAKLSLSTYDRKTA